MGSLGSKVLAKSEKVGVKGVGPQVVIPLAIVTTNSF